MNLSALEKLTRRGSILTGEENGQQGIFELAQTVTTKNGHEWRARSAASAAAWLLLLSHRNACLDEAYPTCEFIPPAKNVLLMFRGQAAKYSSLIPTIYRAGKDILLESQAKAWLHVAIELWIEENFKWIIKPHGNFRIDERDTLTIAQHYGIGTILIDWTWDPLNALSFAMHGEQEPSEGVVLIKTQLKDTPHISGPLLPPTFAHRIWKQRGVFQCFTSPPEDFEDLAAQQLSVNRFLKVQTTIAYYFRIIFPIDQTSVEWARARYETIMTDGGPLEELTKWAVEAATLTKHGPPTALCYDHRRDEFEITMNKLGLPLPSPLNKAAPKSVLEDIESTLDYCDVMALRKRGDQWGYDLGALVVFCEGLGGGNSVCRALEKSDSDPRLKIICPVARQPSRERAFIFGANPVLRFERNVRQWYEDQWNDIDLFRPLESKRET